MTKKKASSSEEQGFLRAIEENASDKATRLAYADWLEDHHRPYEAMLQRVQAGVSEVRYKIRRKSDGKFAAARTWSETGKDYRKLAHAKSHIHQQGGRQGKYRNLP